MYIAYQDTKQKLTPNQTQFNIRDIKQKTARRKNLILSSVAVVFYYYFVKLKLSIYVTQKTSNGVLVI